MRALCSAVVAVEATYVQLVGEHALCTPRSIKSGWKEQLQQDIADHRGKITTAKADLLFDALIESRLHHRRLVEKEE